ncbi:MAG: hypothetical protein KIT02_04925 [Devosia sp.]|uniref:hypothetical protein n=1 Tax=Devosia sp. TaxID=1871048 RepID=UPI0024C7C848|nr:hypothetical protein [Devosia sp.]UYO00561.1 MAG: hypothetical protein KIT02_04925 [Devosia sp.]
MAVNQQSPEMHQHQDTTTTMTVARCDGRLLSAEDVLGLRTSGKLPAHTMPLLLSGWLGLLLILSSPIAGLFTLFAAPLLLTHVTAARHA